MSSINLYVELKEILKSYKKKLSDIKFVCSNKYIITTKSFINIAKKTTYDSGYGANETPSDLKIVGDNWWIERYDYDGKEWFVFKTIPTTENKAEKTLTGFNLKDAEYEFE